MDEEQEKVLVEKLTEGRGGAFFYFSQDKCVAAGFVLFFGRALVLFFPRVHVELHGRSLMKY